MSVPSVQSETRKSGRHNTNKKRSGEDQVAAVQMSSTVIPLCKALEDEILPVECALMPSGVSIPDERYTCETASHSQCDRLEMAESCTWKTEEMMASPQTR